jgi:hypothetical protein
MLGCAAFLLGIVAVVVIATGRAFPLVLGAAILVALVWDVSRRWYVTRLARRVQRVHLGKDLLIVYTDSPHWKAHIESNWVARWPNRTVPLNRSHPWSRKQPEAVLWLAVAGIREHTPLAVVIPRTGRLRVIRFYKAFQESKHGDDTRLRAAEQELENAMSEAPGA